MRSGSSWQASRSSYLRQLEGQEGFNPAAVAAKEASADKAPYATPALLGQWIADLLGGRGDNARIDLLLKRFEVTRKIYGTYDETFRPTDKSDYREPGRYALFGVVLVLAYRNTGRLPYLNALLKMNDILCSTFAAMDSATKKMFRWLLEEERELITTLIEKRHAR